MASQTLAILELLGKGHEAPLLPRQLLCIQGVSFGAFAAERRGGSLELR